VGDRHAAAGAVTCRVRVLHASPLPMPGALLASAASGRSKQRPYFCRFWAFSILAHESRRATVRLNTSFFGDDSTESTQK